MERGRAKVGMTKNDLRAILEHIALDDSLTRRIRSERFAAAIVMWLNNHEADDTIDAFETFDSIMIDIVKQHNLQLH